MKAGKKIFVVPGMEIFASARPALTFGYFSTAAQLVGVGFTRMVLRKRHSHTL